MGEVAMTFKVFPQGVEADIGKIKAEILKLRPKEVREVPIAFGLKLLEVLFVVPDEEGNKLEDALKKIPGVANVEAESVTLL